jgi:hypothetical protein
MADTLSLDQITNEPDALPPRVVISGTHKIGKTVWASSIPGVVVLPIKNEEGLVDLPVPHTPVIESYQTLLDWLRLLASKEHAYKAIVIDSVSALEPLVHQETIARWNGEQPRARTASIEQLGGGWRKGYTESVKEWIRLLSALDYIRKSRGISPVLISHAIVRKHEDPMAGSWDVWDMAIDKLAANAILRWVDCSLFANIQTAMEEDAAGNIKPTAVKRCLHTRCSPSHTAGGRGVYGHLPPVLPLSYAAFAESVRQVKDKMCPKPQEEPVNE